jgi:hypothetical protein
MVEAEYIIYIYIYIYIIVLYHTQRHCKVHKLTYRRDNINIHSLKWLIGDKFFLLHTVILTKANKHMDNQIDYSVE